MADTAVAITAGTGTNIDTRTEATNGNHRQVVVLGDPSTNAGVAPVDATKGLAVDLTASGALPTVTNLAQMGGAALNMGAGTTGTGTQRVVLASDSVNANGQATMANSAPVVPSSNWMATGSAVPSSAPYMGGNAITSLPSAATAGNLTGVSIDKFGRQIMLPVTIRDLVGTQTTTISASTSETTIVTAAASTFNDLVMLVVSNTSASTTTRIDFRDTTAGSVLFSLTSIGGQPPVGFCPSVPIPQTSVNTNWTAQCSASTTDVRIYAVYAKNK